MSSSINFILILGIRFCVLLKNIYLFLFAGGQFCPVRHLLRHRGGQQGGAEGAALRGQHRHQPDEQARRVGDPHRGRPRPAGHPQGENDHYKLQR